jgi:uncharacterized protein (DUF2252 family)
MSTAKCPAPADRQRLLTAERNRKMAASAHAYVRGSTASFYAWLEQAGAMLPAGPPVWICGDCHVGNLGPVASTSGALAIQIRDLDQAVIGNPAHDLVRLALSLAMAARGSDLPGVTTAHILEHMVEGYAAAFAPERHDLDGEAAEDEQPRMVRLVMREAAGRSWKHLADERIEGTKPVIPLGKRFWPLSPEERGAIEALVAGEPMRRLATALRSRQDGATVRLMDAAYWRKGCSSLGRLRFAVLVAVGHGRAERHCLMDIKEAVAAAAPRAPGGDMPRDNAERVVAGARHLSPHLGGRMLGARLLEASVFVRELLPQDLKLDVDHLSREEAVSMACYLAGVVGRGHARQMNGAERRAWVAELGRSRSKSLDAPSWLWNSVVALVSAHEGAYLQHCRKYALAEAA